MDNQNTEWNLYRRFRRRVLILVLMDNQNTTEEHFISGEERLNPCSNG